MVKFIKINEYDVVEVGKYPGVLEIGYVDTRCTCGDGSCDASVHGGDYINIPHEQVPELIRELVRLYPEWGL